MLLSQGSTARSAFRSEEKLALGSQSSAPRPQLAGSEARPRVTRRLASGSLRCRPRASMENRAQCRVDRLLREFAVCDWGYAWLGRSCGRSGLSCGNVRFGNRCRRWRPRAWLSRRQAQSEAREFRSSPVRAKQALESARVRLQACGSRRRLLLRPERVGAPSAGWSSVGALHFAQPRLCRRGAAQAFAAAELRRGPRSRQLALAPEPLASLQRLAGPLSAAEPQLALQPRCSRRGLSGVPSVSACPPSGGVALSGDGATAWAAAAVSSSVGPLGAVGLSVAAMPGELTVGAEASPSATGEDSPGSPARPGRRSRLPARQASAAFEPRTALRPRPVEQRPPVPPEELQASRPDLASRSRQRSAPQALLAAAGSCLLGSRASSPATSGAAGFVPSAVSTGSFDGAVGSSVAVSGGG